MTHNNPPHVFDEQFGAVQRMIGSVLSSEHAIVRASGATAIAVYALVGAGIEEVIDNRARRVREIIADPSEQM